MTDRILIIEDEPHIRRLMAMAESSGYDVSTAEDAPSGLAQFADGSGVAVVDLYEIAVTRPRQ